MSSAKEEVNVSKMYSENAKLSKNDFISKFGITENGVSSENAEQKIKNYGLRIMDCVLLSIIGKLFIIHIPYIHNSSFIIHNL